MSCMHCTRQASERLAKPKLAALGEAVLSCRRTVHGGDAPLSHKNGIFMRMKSFYLTDESKRSGFK